MLLELNIDRSSETVVHKLFYLFMSHDKHRSIYSIKGIPLVRCMFVTKMCNLIRKHMYVNAAENYD